jgi:hypothetical protein
MNNASRAEPALMDPATQLLVSRRVEAASALRSMVIGAAGMVMGAGFVLCVAFNLGVGFRGRIESEAVTVVLAALIGVLGSVSFVRGLVVREESNRGADPISVALVTLVTVPLGALAIGGYWHAHPPDKRLTDPALPYAFTYPGQWERDPDADLPSNHERYYMAGVSKQVKGGVTQGALVQVFEHDHPETLDDSLLRQLHDDAFTTKRSRIDLDGRTGFRIDYRLPTGAPYGSQVAVRDGDEIYWITCVYKENSGAARKGCDKLLDSFRVIGLVDPPR